MPNDECLKNDEIQNPKGWQGPFRHSDFFRHSSLDIRRSSPAPCYVDSCPLGRGLFAGATIAPGSEILRFSGPVLSLSEVRARGPAAANALQVGIDRYLYLDEPGRYVNHSCAPNAAVVDDTRLIALRSIVPDEEIQFDYSTTISDGWTMPCRCGTSECRGLVVAFQLLPEPLRRRYAILGHVQSFILELVAM